jgi:hypothetical protein
LGRAAHNLPFEMPIFTGIFASLTIPGSAELSLAAVALEKL